MTDVRDRGSRRGFLAALLLLPWLASARARAQGFDPLALYRALRDRKLATRNVSKPVRLVDESSGRGAVLRLATGGGPDTALTVRFGQGPRFHAHTVSVRNGLGESFAVEPLPPEQTTNPNGEWAVVALRQRHLDLLCSSDELTITLRGWDETLASSLSPKSVQRLRDFCERPSKND
ncbi:MAG: hypothetical protein AAF690_22560 [Acidobacteriota bacterium]